MSTYSGSPDLEQERDRVRAAAERLLSGAACASSGRLNVVALAEEAGINRTSLYQRHPDLVQEFKTKAGGAPGSTTVQAIQGQLDAARARVAQLEREKGELEERVRSLGAVIVEMSLEADQDSNVIAFRSSSRSLR